MTARTEPDASTRRQALALAAATGAALASRPAAARAASPDRAPLDALVAYQEEVVVRYERALSNGPFRDRATLEQFRRDAGQAAAALRKALEDAGGKPPPVPDRATAPPPADRSRRGYLRDLISAEKAAVASYYAALQDLEGERHLAGAAAFMAQAGRRLVVLRDLAGDELLPSAFETGST